MNSQNEIKAGAFIEGSYKCGCIAGIVTKVLKNTATITVYNLHYRTATVTNVSVNVTKTRINKVYANINVSGFIIQ